MSMKITEATWMFLDTETTGIKPSEGAQVIELGWVIVKSMQIEGSADFLINPGKPLPPIITKITHITDEMLQGQPAFGDIANKFLAEFRECDFIAAYKKDFDREQLDAEFARLGAKLPEKTWMDPLTWARHFSGLDSNTLTNVATQFKVSLENAHRADADAKAAAEVMIKFFEWGVEEAAFPDDVDMLKASERQWRQFANQKSRLMSPLKVKGKVQMTGEPGKMAQDIYDNYNRDRLMKLGNRGRWGK